MVNRSDTDIFNTNTYIKYALIPSVMILIILSLLQRRSKPNPCGYYIPGLVLPIRFLDGFQDRWSYALSFGAITGILISVFFKPLVSLGTEDEHTQQFFLFCPASEDDSGPCHQVWVKTLLLQVQAMIISLVCAPHFVCITTPYKLIGALFGFAYSAYWIVFYIMGAVRIAENYENMIDTLMLLTDLPVILCFIGLCIRSLWAIYRCYATKTVRIQRVENLVEQHQVDHVITLFRPLPEDPPVPEGRLQKVKVKAKAKLELFRHFRLPSRVICIAFVQLIIIYYMGLTVTRLGVASVPAVRTVGDYFNWSSKTRSDIIHIFDSAYVISEVLSLLSSVIYITLFIINFRINMMDIYKGKRHLFTNAEIFSSSRHMAESLRLPGYQIAYILWGFMVSFFVLLVFLLFILYLIYCLYEFELLKDAVNSLLQTLSVPVITIGIFYAQVLWVRMFLLQPKLKMTDKHPPLNVNNRHLYEVAAYMLIFSNLLVGLVSVLFRTIKSFLLGIIFLGRLDRCLLMRGFESLDPGYMAYVGTLMVDNTHNNPVMRTFCAVLVRLTCTLGDKQNRGIAHLLEPMKTGSNSKAARRWYLAYTLLKNPDLLPRRKLALLLIQGITVVNDDANSHSRDSSSSSSRDGFSSAGKEWRQSTQQGQGNGNKGAEISLEDVHQFE